MSCFCNLFNDPIVWLIIIALILLFMNCNGCGCNRCDRDDNHCRGFEGCGCAG
ncbi:MAG: hypothetical protein ACI3YK_07010 [Eubacteriales bacterium]